MIVLRMKPLVWLLACVVGLCCGAGPVNAEDSAVPAIPALSAAEFFELPVPERRAVLRKALNQRLRLFENIASETKSRRYVLREDLSTFPYGGEIPGPTEQQIFDMECVTRCRGESYWQKSRMILQESPQIKAGTMRKELRAVKAGDGELFRAIQVNNDEIDDSTASITHHHSGHRRAGLLKYWGRGEAGWHDFYFINDAVRALESLSDAELDTQPRIKSGMIGARETISFSYPFHFFRQQDRPGMMTVHFDPARQFLPLAYRLECYDREGEGRELRVFEAMRVAQAEQQQGIWFPKRFQILKCNGLPTGEEAESVNEVRVESVSFGTVTDKDLAFTFPAGVEVRDDTTGVRYTADGKGGVQGEVQGIPYLNQRFLGRAIGPFLLKFFFPCLGISMFLLGWYMIRRQERIDRQQSVSPGV